jgi:hypothetical protein
MPVLLGQAIDSRRGQANESYYPESKAVGSLACFLRPSTSKKRGRCLTGSTLRRACATRLLHWIDYLVSVSQSVAVDRSLGQSGDIRDDVIEWRPLIHERSSPPSASTDEVRDRRSIGGYDSAPSPQENQTKIPDTGTNRRKGVRDSRIHIQEEHAVISSSSEFSLSSGHRLILDRTHFEFRLEPSRLLQTACYAFHFPRVLLAPG